MQNSLMWSLMTDVYRNGCAYRYSISELTDKEKDIVYHGPAEKKHIFIKRRSQSGRRAGFTYYNAVYTVKCTCQGEGRRGYEACRNS